MEEQVGALWHRLVTRLSDRRFPKAAVSLPEVSRTLSIYFRALGGDAGLEVTSAEEWLHGARRGWLQRLAGTQRRIALAWRDDRYLRLPGRIDWLPERDLNRDLYLWLAALAVADDGSGRDWFQHSQSLTAATLARFPGLMPRYRRLVVSHLDLRPAPERLPQEEARRERALRQALQRPGTVTDLPLAPVPPQPVPLWLHPAPPQLTVAGSRTPEDNNNQRDGLAREPEEPCRRRAERVRAPEEERGLVTIRMENILSWSEFVHVDRSCEDEDDPDRAEATARDLDRLSVARNQRAAAARLKFDLDLPAEAEDDLVLGEGMRLPEWDWKRQRLLPEHCRIQPMVAAEAGAVELPDHLKVTARRLRRQFQALVPARTWHRAQADGQELDLDAVLRFRADRAAGAAAGGDGLYLQLRPGARDLSCLLMADLSLSTDTWIDDYHRVIDVIRDSLFLFAESLAASGDRFAMYGFSSRRRDPVRVHTLKTFDRPYDARVRGHIAQIKPGYYTRMGAAIRYATRLLQGQSQGRRLLLLISDGKPNDLDQYEGRYGIEDTRQAVLQAKAAGLEPFCVTIDEKGNDYLPHLFGSNGYVVIRNPGQLPRRLPQLYLRLTA
jgi:nitric oxide reductase NorD protein